MPTRVKISHFSNQFKTFSNNVFGQSFASDVLAGQSVTHHNLALVIFNNEIGKNKWAYIIKHLTSCLPVVYRSSKRLFAGPSISGIFLSTENILKPQYQYFIATRNFKHRMKLKTASILALFNLAKIKATFSINYARKIRDLCNGLIFIKDNYFGHDKSFTLSNDYNYISINERYEKVYAERLSEKDLQRYATV